MFSLIKLFSILFLLFLFLKHNSKYSFELISSPVSGSILSKLKSLNTHINFGANSFIIKSLSSIVFVATIFDKCAAKAKSFIDFSSIFPFVL